VKDKPVAPAAGAPAAGEAGADDAPAAPIAPVTSPAGFTYGDFSYDPYAKSDIVLEAEALLQQWQANKPGSYTPVWQDEADSYLNQFQNRDPFSYNMNADALYNQYKDAYIQQGRMAMMDTMGQAAAMTGGYGNSYAQTVGQQAYNQQLNQLSEIVPELYQMAYDRYGKEGQEMLDMYNLYMNREAQEYGRHQDTVDNWYREMSRLTDNANTLYERDYNDYLRRYDTALNEYNTDRSEAFDQWQTMQSQEFTDKNTGGGTGGSGIELDHVASMSSYELVGYLQSYKKKGDNDGLASFLDDCVETGRLSRQAADDYYATYLTKEDDGGQIPTDVNPIGDVATEDPWEREQYARRYGSKGGKYPTKVTLTSM
jgi:hypothetical protein